VTDKRTFYLVHDVARAGAVEAVRTAPAGFVVTIQPKTRTLEQNARLWAMLGEVSRQVTWYGQKLTADEWKDVATAALKRQRVVPGIDGGFVVLGAHTRRMTVADMCELIDFLDAFGAQQGVKFADTCATHEA
tara:strand:- start:32 stop:430 length:399 start_codon:yes stop_codon:yes gene_type:complete